MFLVPYGVDNPMSRWPWMNWALIGANVAVFGLEVASGTETGFVGMVPYVTYRLVSDYALTPGDFRWYQLLTSGFLHVGFWHLFFNMLALWTFGNNVNDRLGHLRYLLLYLGCEVAADVGHVVVEWGSLVPAVGASGAVFGVMGLYVVFFPLNDVRVFYLLWIRPGTFTCSSFWMIGLYVVLNVYAALTGGGGNVAVAAHLTGFGAGFGAGVFLLRRGFVERDEYDLLSWLSGRRRRRLEARYASTPALPDGSALPPAPAAVQSPAPSRPTGSAREYRRTVAELLDMGEVQAAAAAYEEFAEAYPDKALGEAAQARLANVLFRARLYGPAAAAYERFARAYPHHPQAADMLYSAGVLCIRKLHEGERGRRLLAEALPALRDPAKAARARAELQHS